MKVQRDSTEALNKYLEKVIIPHYGFLPTPAKSTSRREWFLSLDSFTFILLDSDKEDPRGVVILQKSPTWSEIYRAQSVQEVRDLLSKLIKSMPPPSEASIAKSICLIREITLKGEKRRRALEEEKRLKREQELQKQLDEFEIPDSVLESILTTSESGISCFMFLIRDLESEGIDIRLLTGKLKQLGYTVREEPFFAGEGGVLPHLSVKW